MEQNNIITVLECRVHTDKVCGTCDKYANKLCNE